MAGNHGAFCWYELMTTDMAAAASYYAQVVGWDAAPMPATVVHYTRFLAGSVPVAGVMDLPPELREMKIPPHWGAYVAVDDVDATAAHAVALGGTVAWGPMDIQDIGRFASLRDPQGAHLGIMRGPMPVPGGQWIIQTTDPQGAFVSLVSWEP